MKTTKNLLLIVLSLITGATFAQTALTGAWKMNEGSVSHHLFFQDGFYFHTVHDGKQFLSSQGGKYIADQQSIKAELLYNSADSGQVGSSMAVPFKLSGDKLSLHVDQTEIQFQRVDDSQAPLAGVWRITGRMGADGKVTAIHQSGSRQTYKLLTGTKFQWVAIDPGKKQFSGTGGGSYTFKDGKYTENIEFFSRDNSRVGASLGFDGKLENGDWHHSGLSSKGDKIYEVWSRLK